MKAYIQQVNNQFEDDWLYAAYLGFNKLGMQTIFFEDINEVPVQKDNIVIAFIPETKQHFLKWSFVIPPLNIHPTIQNYCKRNMSVITMKDLRNIEKLPIFVKPYSSIKQFDTGVMTSKSSLSFFDNVHENEKVIISDVIDIVSEYRGFVYNNKLVGLHWYAGDFKIFPDVSVIESAVYDFSKSTTAVPCTQSTKPPVAYTIDFGVANIDGKLETVLIELNDMWSVGNYGFDAKLYARMLRDRWMEIFKDFK